MDRQAIISKIQAAIRLKENTSFAEEAANAAKIIEKLASQYQIDLNEISAPIIEDELFESFNKMSTVRFMLLDYVSKFYDAQGYKMGKSFRVIGSEAQQIQVKVYYDFIVECMEKEVEKAYSAEKILSEILGKHLSRSFKNEFRISFVITVGNRLNELKEKEHEHAEHTREFIAKTKFKTLKTKLNVGEGTIAGYNAGNSVSLHRQMAS